jgi:hypothetical protein
MYINYYVKKVAQKLELLTFFSNKSAQSKQCPKGRNSAQSGHPAQVSNWVPVHPAVGQRLLPA